MKKFKVVLAAPSAHEEEIEMLRKEGGEVKFIPTPSQEELIKECKDADALIVGIAEVTGNLIKQSKKLKIIARHGAGYDNIDVKTATEEGIFVTNTPGVNIQSVAEFTFGLILSLVRNIASADANMKSGGWRKESYWGIELKGKTIGVIGFDKIGRKVGMLARCFGMEVLAYDPYIPEEEISKAGAKKVDLETLLAGSDIISLHVPLTDKTRGLIGEKEISQMKKGAYIVNVSRGKVVDEKALYKALVNRQIAGAALDVFSEEPPVDYSLIKLPNVVATPHIAAWTEVAKRKMALTAAEQVIMTLKGKVPTYSVNSPVAPRIKTIE